VISNEDKATTYCSFLKGSPALTECQPCPFPIAEASVEDIPEIVKTYAIGHLGPCVIAFIADIDKYHEFIVQSNMVKKRSLCVWIPETDIRFTLV